MNVLIDTCIWSAVLRRDRPDATITSEVRRLALEHRVRMIGPIRQELLSGLRSETQFTRMRTYLHAFDDLPLGSHHYEHAAQLHNVCRKRGVQGSHIDFLICAVAKIEKWAIFTNDDDFERYNDVVGLTLFVSGR
jgi:predicted nucleic acid-binding protein